MSEEVAVEEVAEEVTEESFEIYGGPYADEDDRINEAYRNDTLDELDTTGFSQGALALIKNMEFLKTKEFGNPVIHPSENNEPIKEEPLFSELGDL